MIQAVEARINRDMRTIDLNDLVKECGFEHTGKACYYFGVDMDALSADSLLYMHLLGWHRPEG